MTRDKARKRAVRQRMVEQDEPYIVVAVTGSGASSLQMPDDAAEEERLRREIEREWWFVRWPCPDGCQSEYRMWQVPAGSMVSCATCGEPVCVECQGEPVAYEFGQCRYCEHEANQPLERPKPTCTGQCISVAAAWDAAHPC